MGEDNNLSIYLSKVKTAKKVCGWRNGERKIRENYSNSRQKETRTKGRATKKGGIRYG